MKLISFLVVLLSFFSGLASAEGVYLATDVNILAITNTSANGKSFNILVGNGDDDEPCENTTITFLLSAAGNDENIHNRAFFLSNASIHQQ